MTPNELIDWTLKDSNRPDLAYLEENNWVDVQPEFETAHFLNGFGHPDGKYRFKPDWKNARFKPGSGPYGPVDDMPAIAGPLERHRGGERGLSFPARHEPGAHLPQFVLQ